MSEDEERTVGLDLRRGATSSTRGDVLWPPTSGVALIGGSPALTLDGQPVLWFENWIRARTRRERAYVAPRG